MFFRISEVQKATFYERGKHPLIGKRQIGDRLKRLLLCFDVERRFTTT